MTKKFPCTCQTCVMKHLVKMLDGRTIEICSNDYGHSGYFYELSDGDKTQECTKPMRPWA